MSEASKQKPHIKDNDSGKVGSDSLILCRRLYTREDAVVCIGTVGFNNSICCSRVSLLYFDYRTFLNTPDNLLLHFVIVDVHGVG